MLRTAVTADIESIIDIHSSAFAYTDNRKLLQERRDILNADLSGWLVYEPEGKMVGCLRIRPDRIRIGNGILLKGEVGDVAVHKNFHGKGYGTRILTEAIEWMHEAGFGASRLGGLAKFYSRFGYFRFPRHYVEFITHEETPRAGGSIIEGKTELPKDVLKCVRLFDKDIDTDTFNELYNDTLSRYSGTLVYDTPQYTCPDNGPFNIVYEEDGEVKAFVFVYERGAKRTEFEQAMDIVCFGYKEGCEKQLAWLTAQTFNSCYDKNCTNFTARYPFDTQLLAALGEVDIRYIACETYGGTGTNMMQIINLSSLLEHLKPELENRIDALLPDSFNKALQIDIGKSKACIRILADRVEIQDEISNAEGIQIPEVQMLKLAMGLNSFDEFYSTRPSDQKHLSKQSLLAMKLLFPKIVLMPGIWG